MTLDYGFEDFLKSIYKDRPTGEQFKQLRQAYYAGALIGGIVMRESPPRFLANIEEFELSIGITPPTFNKANN